MNVAIKKVCTGLLCAAALFGCSAKNWQMATPSGMLSETGPAAAGRTGVSTSADPSGIVVEVETVEQQALSAVMSSATDFKLPWSEERLSWDRTKDFFAEHFPKQMVQELSGESGSVIMTLGGADVTHYTYHVERDFGHDGVTYHVTVRPSSPASSAELADRNARNLARFIKEGALEVSLLAQ